VFQYIKEADSLEQEWKIWDFVQCENLDIYGDFDVQLTSLSDLDSNGVLETTVVYKLICAGGIEPKMCWYGDQVEL